MPRSPIRWRLLPVNRAWKRLTTLLLKRSKAFKRTATGVTAAISTVLSRRRRRGRRFRVGKRHSSSSLPADARGTIRRQKQPDFVPVYVDNLFAKPAGLVHIQTAQTEVHTGKLLVEKAASAAEGCPVAAAAGRGSPSEHGSVASTGCLSKSVPAGDSTISKIEGRGGRSSSSPVEITHLKGVDLRAELFIAQFKEEMRRQRQSAQIRGHAPSSF